MPAAAKDKKDKAKGHEGGPPFEVELVSEQAEFLPEDPVTLTATVYNNTDMEVLFDVARLGTSGKYDLLTVKDEALESGSWDPQKELKAKRVLLKAHASLSRFVNLPKDVVEAFRAEGRMRVSVEVCDTAFGGDAAASARTRS